MEVNFIGILFSGKYGASNLMWRHHFKKKPCILILAPPKNYEWYTVDVVVGSFVSIEFNFVQRDF